MEVPSLAERRLVVCGVVAALTDDRTRSRDPKLVFDWHVRLLITISSHIVPLFCHLFTPFVDVSLQTNESCLHFMRNSSRTTTARRSVFVQSRDDIRSSECDILNIYCN